MSDDEKVWRFDSKARCRKLLKPVTFDCTAVRAVVGAVWSKPNCPDAANQLLCRTLGYA